MKEKIVTINELLHTPIGAIAKYPAEQLSALIIEAANNLAHAKRVKSWIDLAVELKYEEHVKAKRLRMGKDSGVIHLDDNGFKVTVTSPKRVEWNQRELKKIIAELVVRGFEVDDFVITSYKVAENKYKNWSSSMQTIFSPARTVRVGDNKYVLSEIDNSAVDNMEVSYE